MIRVSCLLVLILSLFLLGGCEGKPRTAQSLADELKSAGVAWDSAEPFAHPVIPNLKIEEAILLKADGLHVEILRTGDERSFKLMSSAGAILLMASVEAKKKAGTELPQKPDIVAFKPFVLVVREETTKGAVRDAATKVLGK